MNIYLHGYCKLTQNACFSLLFYFHELLKANALMGVHFVFKYVDFYPIIHFTPSVAFADCQYNGLVYQAGQSFKPDQCNTCWCTVSGDVSCTKFSCYPGRTFF